jgi:hypothetical protein
MYFNVFCWKSLRPGKLVGMLGRVYLVQWQGDTSHTLCLKGDFDVAIPLEQLQENAHGKDQEEKEGRGKTRSSCQGSQACK